MITKNYTTAYDSESEREKAIERFTRNGKPTLLGEEKEIGMSLYQINSSTEMTLMNGKNGELAIEIRGPEKGIANLVKLLQTETYLGTKLEEEN